MLRKSLLLIACTLILSLAPAEPAQAGRWSPGNPGIYGNIHGMTYRSMRYEREQGTRQSYVRRSHSRNFRFFRR